MPAGGRGERSTGVVTKRASFLQPGESESCEVVIYVASDTTPRQGVSCLSWTRLHRFLAVKSCGLRVGSSRGGQVGRQPTYSNDAFEYVG